MEEFYRESRIFEIPFFQLSKMSTSAGSRNLRTPRAANDTTSNPKRELKGGETRSVKRRNSGISDYNSISEISDVLLRIENIRDVKEINELQHKISRDYKELTFEFASSSVNRINEMIQAIDDVSEDIGAQYENYKTFVRGGSAPTEAVIPSPIESAIFSEACRTLLKPYHDRISAAEEGYYLQKTLLDENLRRSEAISQRQLFKDAIEAREKLCFEASSQYAKMNYQKNGWDFYESRRRRTISDRKCSARIGQKQSDVTQEVYNAAFERYRLEKDHSLIKDDDYYKVVVEVENNGSGYLKELFEDMAVKKPSIKLDERGRVRFHKKPAVQLTRKGRDGESGVTSLSQTEIDTDLQLMRMMAGKDVRHGQLCQEEEVE